MRAHDIKVTTFHGTLRMVACSCGWGVGCHTSRKALRLAEEHRAHTEADTTDRPTMPREADNG